MKRVHWSSYTYSTTALILSLVATGCADDGRDGAPGTDGLRSLIAQSSIGPGAACANGGVRIEAGIDTNGNGVLESSEVTSTTFLCNGEGGPAGGSDPALAAIANRPRSSMMAVTLDPGSAFASIPAYTKSLVQRYARGETVLEGNFPLRAPSRSTDFSGVLLQGLRQNLVVSWFDAISPERDADAPRYGANNDYIAYFGDGWNAGWAKGVVGRGPMFAGSSNKAWLWSNHEYISNDYPRPLAAPNGQYLTLATFLSSNGLLRIADPTDDRAWTQSLVDEHIIWEKRQHGGSWLRVERQPNGEWKMIPHAGAKRYDSTDATLARITGYTLAEQDTNDRGGALPTDVVVGITADCSGGQSPWGTVFTAEENAQSQWGDLESTWVSDRQFILDNPNFGAGRNIRPDFSASDDSEFGRHSDKNTKHNRDVYGFLVEMDPGQPADNYYESVNGGGDGLGHRKLGSMGRARWENVDFVTTTTQSLIPDQRIVLYAANDRRAGRIYKWISEQPYTVGMTRGEVRALLDAGRLYVGHWANLDALTGLTRFAPDDPDWAACSGAGILNSTAGATATTAIANCPALTQETPGRGVWIEMSVNNTTDIAPNAVANGDPTRTVGAALRDVNWNGVGGFPTDNDVLSALFTAAAKIGIRELNRPEDVEWNPFDRTLYIAFTYHGRTIGMKQDGTLILRNRNGDRINRKGAVLRNGEPLPSRSIASLHDFVRADNFGSIFRLVEDNGTHPAESRSFSFYPVFLGSQGDTAFDTARPDNLSIDAEGGVWFGTDGNTSGSTNRAADGIHYLDLEPAHRAGQPGIVRPTWGVGFRILHSANDAEATGPAFNANMDTLFYNVQHPGEGRASAWPASQPELREDTR